MTRDDNRASARRLVAQHLARGDALGWFDALYLEAQGHADRIPWADLQPNPYLANWLGGTALSPQRALVVGCGLGDDAELLASLGWSVVAFDVSAEAVRWARQRFPQSKVEYVVADLFEPPRQWERAFNLVLEIYTLQALPVPLRARAVPMIAQSVAPNGVIFLFARGREELDPPGEMPWPLTEREVRTFVDTGLVCRSLEDFMDDQTPPVRRFRAVFQRPAGPAE